jgi:hypothetical protein
MSNIRQNICSNRVDPTFQKAFDQACSDSTITEGELITIAANIRPTFYAQTQPVYGVYYLNDVESAQQKVVMNAPTNSQKLEIAISSCSGWANLYAPKNGKIYNSNSGSYSPDDSSANCIYAFCLDVLIGREDHSWWETCSL